MRRKKNRVYPSPEAVSRATDSRERLRKYSLQSDTERPLSHPWARARVLLVLLVRAQTDAAPAGTTDHTRYAHSRGRQCGSRACTRTQATHL